MFLKDERENILDPHHGGLVLALCIAKYYVRRLLMDGGRPINLILRETL